MLGRYFKLFLRSLIIKSDLMMSSHAGRYLKIFIGSLIAGLGYSTFIIPAKLLASGLSGIAVIVYYLVDLPIGVQLIVYNIPIVYIAYKVFGRLYAIDTIIGTVMLSVAIDATSFIGNYHIVEDPILNAVFGGGLSAAVSCFGQIPTAAASMCSAPLSRSIILSIWERWYSVSI